MHSLVRLVSIVISYTLLVALVGRAVSLWARLLVSRLQRKTKPRPLIATSTAPPVEEITPLHDFQYENVEPIKYRPFETKRNVAMEASKNPSSRIGSGWIENTWIECGVEEALWTNTPKFVWEISNHAIQELYQEIILDLLQKRFPTIFRIDGNIFQNLVTGSGIAYALL
ncbi:hypothetical protein ABVK25_001049 [Lepraria finkii]|uniref:Uncharacterized protein n=1 Tax=Lepraria finkii TaxID=1340010 RepID=A0ABR4BKV7_9LECA